MFRLSLLVLFLTLPIRAADVPVAKVEGQPLAGNVVRIRGYFRGEVDFDPGSGSFLLNAGEDFKSYVWTLNADGSFVSASIVPTGNFPDVSQVVESPTGEKTIIGFYLQCSMVGLRVFPIMCKHQLK